MAWLLLCHGGSHPTGGGLLPCTGPGHCGEHLVPGPLVVGSAKDGLVFFWLLWHIPFLQLGRPFLALFYLANCLCPEELRSVITSYSSASVTPTCSPGVPPLAPPGPGSPLLMLIKLGSLAIYLLFYPVGLTPPLACAMGQDPGQYLWRE